MRAVLSELAVAIIGRCGWGVESQMRVEVGGVRVARGEIWGMVVEVEVG